MSEATLAARPQCVVAGGKGRSSGDGGDVAFGGLMGSVRVIEMQLVAFIVVFSVSGLVPLSDMLFPVGVTLYAFLLSALVFPRYETTELKLFKRSRVFQLYIVAGTVVGLFLPLSYVLGGFARLDQRSVRAATPHLFLLSCQVLSEYVVSGLELFSLPVRALLSIMYNTRRLFALADWNREEFMDSDLPRDPTFDEGAWFWFGRGLAAVNTLYFAAHLFGFLIPVFLPRAFECYFQARDIHLAKVRKREAEARAEAEKKQAQERERHSHLPVPAPPPGIHKKAH